MSSIPRLAIAVFYFRQSCQRVWTCTLLPFLSVYAHLIFLLVSEAEEEAGSGKQTLMSMLCRKKWRSGPGIGVA